MAAIECKLAMVISRLVEFELLLELKIEQKSCTSRDSLRYKAAASLNSPCANSTVCPSQLYISISPHRTSGNCPNNERDLCIISLAHTLLFDLISSSLMHLL
jgi:hypothetical protein